VVRVRVRMGMIASSFGDMAETFRG
jgi:hypothetical protein